MGGGGLGLQGRPDHLDVALTAGEHLPAGQGEGGVFRVIAGEAQQRVLRQGVHHRPMPHQ